MTEEQKFESRMQHAREQLARAKAQPGGASWEDLERYERQVEFAKQQNGE